jgi:hypothetical protein
MPSLKANGRRKAGEAHLAAAQAHDASGAPATARAHRDKANDHFHAADHHIRMFYSSGPVKVVS